MKIKNLPIQSDNDQHGEDNSKQLISSHYFKLIWLVAIVNSINQASQTSMSLRDNHFSISSALVFSTITLITSLAMSGRFAVANVQQLAQSISDQSFMSAWKEISYSKRAMLISSGLLISSYVIFSDSIQSCFYTQSLPEEYEFQDHVSNTAWKVFSGGMAAVIACNTAFGEAPEILSALREWHMKDQTFFYKKSAMLLGGSVGLLGAIADGLLAFSGMKKILGISSHLSVGGITAMLFSSLNILGDFSLNGRFNIKNIDELMQYLATHRLQVKEISAFLLALIISCMMGYVIHDLVEALLYEESREFGIDHFLFTSFMIHLISYGAGLNELFSDVGALYSSTYEIINYCFNRYQKVTASKLNNDNEYINEKTPLINEKTAELNTSKRFYQANHSPVFFKNRSEKTNIQVEKKWCLIL